MIRHKKDFLCYIIWSASTTLAIETNGLFYSIKTQQFHITDFSLSDAVTLLKLSKKYYCLLSPNGSIIFVCPELERLMKQPVNSLHQQAFATLFHPDDVVATLQAFKDAQGGAQEATVTNRLRLPDVPDQSLLWHFYKQNKSGSIYAVAEDCEAGVYTKDLIGLLANVGREMSYGVTLTTGDGKFIWVNEAFTRMTGYSSNEVRSKKPLEVLGGPLTDTHINKFLKNQIDKGQPFFLERINYKKNGEPFLMFMEGHPMLDGNGCVRGYFGIHHDRTLEKKREQAIIDREKKYRFLFHNSPLATLVYQAETLEILEVNTAACQLYGYSADNFKSVVANSLFSGGKNGAGSLAQLASRDEVVYAHQQHSTVDGRSISVDVTATQVNYRGQRAVLCMIENSTQTQQLQQKLAAQRSRYEKKVLQAKLKTQEVEREKIGKELHDNINQLLCSVKLYHNMALAEEHMRTEAIKKASEILLQAMTEIRNLSHELVGSRFEENGLVPSIQALLSDLEAVNLFKVEFQWENIDEQLPAPIAHHLFRIVQEQLSNIVKHAFARKVTVCLYRKESQVYLNIKDDGTGFETVDKKKGIGFRNINERVKLLEGSLNIISRKGEGCLIEIYVPVVKNMVQLQ